MVLIERDRFDINFFSRIIGEERSKLVFRHFEIVSHMDNYHFGTEGLSYLFANCASVRIVHQEWQKRMIESFRVPDKCHIKSLQSEHCRYSFPEFDA